MQTYCAVQFKLMFTKMSSPPKFNLVYYLCNSYNLEYNLLAWLM